MDANDTLRSRRPHRRSTGEWKNSRGAREGWLYRTAEKLVLNDLVLVRDLETEGAMRDGYTD